MPRTPTAALAALLLFAGLAGCLGDAGPGSGNANGNTTGPPSASPAEASMGFAFRSCTGYSVQVVVPQDALQGSLPEGFEPAPAGSGPTSGSQSLVFIDTFTCGHVTINGTQANRANIMTAKAEVLPPDGFQRGGDARHYLYLAILTENPDLAEAMAGAGLAAAQTDVSVDTTGGDPARLGTAAAQHADATGRIRVATGNLTANEAKITGGEGSRTFGLDQPLGADGRPTVTSVIDRDLLPTNFTRGEGTWELSGGFVPETFPGNGEGLGFDTQDGTYGERFRVSPLPGSDA